ncbi:LysR family transcriptional regulator [Pseudoduganella sp. FT55W]|uniref:LysR family transcriptional regulator n=1 Tax=Duganella rivi TaxID=2666083 RepID=A0A7X4KBV5_9BURK|nr:LysR family transcriptional regulator [Duganella rivi]MYM67674.1 LysR family transcriptional regulator [Duganella rivi]
MKPITPEPEDLRIFSWVARLSSFTKAAEHLQLPRTSISNAIQRLEERLGARLLQRTTRRVQVTREGEALLERCERLLEDLDEIGALFQQQGAQLRGRLRVDMPLGMASDIVLPRLPEFLAAHPELQVDIFSTDRRVDLLGEGFDLVVRAGAVVDESLVYRPLLEMELMNVASPAYVAAHGMPSTLEDLGDHWLINYQPNPASLPAAFEYVQDGRTLHIAMRHKVTVNNSVAYTAACRAGLGIAQQPTLRARADIHAGLLTAVMPDHQPAAMTMRLLFPHRRNIPQRVRVFADWLTDITRSAVAA